MPYDPFNWYWQDDTGKVFSSARLAVVPADDADFATFKAANGYVTAWPRDDLGAQTNASLQEVLTPYGITAFAVPRLVLTPLSFIETSFTPAELLGLCTAALSTPSILLLLLEVVATAQIDLTHTKLVDGINAVKTAGLLTASRAADILAGKPAPTT